MSDSFYDVLDVSPDASTEEMEDAFREKVLETHPDKNDDEDSAEQFKRVKEAKQVLTNPKERQQYDRLGHEAYVKQSGSESLWGIRSSRSSGGTDDRTTRQQSSSTASRQSSRSSSRSSDQSTTGGGSRRNERTGKRKRQRGKQKRGRKRRGGGQKRGQKQQRGKQKRGQKRGEQRRRKREGRQRKKRQGGDNRQRQRQGNQRTKQQQNQRTKQQQNQRTKQQQKRRKKQTRSERERARRQQRGGQQRTERPQQAGGRPEQQEALVSPGLVTIAFSSLGLTAVWLVGRGVMGLLFTFVRAGFSFEVFADTLEFGALAVFSFVLVSAFSSALDVGDLRFGHYVVIFGTWMLALPVLRVMPFRIETFATFVFTYAFIGGASIVVLATIETIESQS